MSTAVKDPVIVSQGNGGNGSGVKVAEVKSPEKSALLVDEIAAQIQAFYERKVKAQFKSAMAMRPESAEPKDWWDLYTVGPIQIPTGTFGVDPVGPFAPSRAIRANEPAFMVTVLILNTAQVNGVIPANLLSGAALPYEVQYVTLNVNTGSPASHLNLTRQFSLNPGQAVYVTVEAFRPTVDTGIMETNVCARILNAELQTPPQWPFAGFATWVFNTDTPSFLDTLIGATSPGFSFDRPARYMTYM